MGNAKTKEAKDIFDKLDRDKRGVINLSDIASIRALPGLASHVSNTPLLLYQFDEAKQGRITKKEFISLVRYLQRLHVKKDEAQPKNIPATTINLENIPELTDRDLPTPAVVNCTPAGEQEEDESEGETIAESVVAVAEKTRTLVHKLVNDTEERAVFVEWFFHLSDLKRNNHIELDELQVLLEILKYDGIVADSLIHDPEKLGKPIGTQAQLLLEEYGGARDGFFNKEQFLILADLILKQYELRTDTPASDRIGKYELKQKIGSGANAVVRLAIDTVTGQKKAVKIIAKGNVSDLSRLDVEIKAMKLLQHPNIVVLEEVMETPENVYFVMELCEGGNVADHVAIEPLHRSTAKYFFTQLADCVRYCHQRGVCHRDLKLENLVLDSEGKNVKVCDFGHAGIFTLGFDFFSTGLMGSLFHISPEQIEGESYSGEKVDVWAMGVVLYRMLMGKPPFYNENAKLIVDLIQQIKYPSEGLPHKVADLLSKIFLRNPQERLTIDEILAHPWLRHHRIKEIPSLFSGKLILEHNTHTSTAWALLHASLKELGIHSFQVKNDLLTLRCHYVTKELRFLANLSPRCDAVASTGAAAAPTSTPTKGAPSHSNAHARPPYFEFTWLSGGGFALRQLIIRIQTVFAKHLEKQQERKQKQPVAVQPQLDSGLLLQTASELAQQFKKLFDKLLHNKATVLLLGKTGADHTTHTTHHTPHTTPQASGRVLWPTKCLGGTSPKWARVYQSPPQSSHTRCHGSRSHSTTQKDLASAL
eukprot:TRINITY_DN1057_c0_g2_i2.p1 TRINITY_DN1057_c0_g2~~TRINITY_DN1057_c0_g2_i2.p1  ORF type:complete len:761 (+),score=219.60 TRINITY_DN1057_c0_g2_i2:167-2449(+)